MSNEVKSVAVTIRGTKTNAYARADIRPEKNDCDGSVWVKDGEKEFSRFANTPEGWEFFADFIHDFIESNIK